MALKELKEKGCDGAYLHLKMFSPFPSSYVHSIIEKFDIDKVIGVEHNYLMQASKIITLNTGIKIERSIAKFTGRPMYLHEVVAAVERILKGDRRVVLTYGA